MTFPASVLIREVGVREGFQSIPKLVTTDKKLELIEALSQTGVTEIEICSFVRADKLPQMADAAQIVQGFKVKPNLKYLALYLNPKGFELAEHSKKLNNKAWISSSVSETFLKHNANTTSVSQLESFSDWMRVFQAAGKPLHGLMLSNAFGCSYEGKISHQQVLKAVSKFVKRAEEFGSTFQEICLADTVGMANPEDLRRLVNLIREQHPKTELSLHLHDTHGLGLANAYAGLLEGVTIFDASVAGLGGCPFTPGASGNICTEDLVFMCHELGIKTGINLELYYQAARLAETIVGYKLPGHNYRFNINK